VTAAQSFAFALGPSGELPILYVDASASRRRAFLDAFAPAWDVLVAEDACEAVMILEGRPVVVLVVDEGLDQVDELLDVEALRTWCPDLRRVLVSRRTTLRLAEDNLVPLHDEIERIALFDDSFRVLVNEIVAAVRIDRMVQLLTDTQDERERLRATAQLQATLLDELTDIATEILVCVDGIVDVHESDLHTPDLHNRLAHLKVARSRVHGLRQDARVIGLRRTLRPLAQPFPVEAASDGRGAYWGALAEIHTAAAAK
jgi:hypothetical protein